MVWRAGQAVGWSKQGELVRDKKGAIHVPKAFHEMARIPNTGLGKVDKKLIRRQLIKGTKVSFKTTFIRSVNLLHGDTA